MQCKLGRWAKAGEAEATAWAAIQRTNGLHIGIVHCSARHIQLLQLPVLAGQQPANAAQQLAASKAAAGEGAAVGLTPVSGVWQLPQTHCMCSISLLAWRAGPGGSSAQPGTRRRSGAGTQMSASGSLRAKVAQETNGRCWPGLPCRNGLAACGRGIQRLPCGPQHSPETSSSRSAGHSSSTSRSAACPPPLCSGQPASRRHRRP